MVSTTTLMRSPSRSWTDLTGHGADRSGAASIPHRAGQVINVVLRGAALALLLASGLVLVVSGLTPVLLAAFVLLLPALLPLLVVVLAYLSATRIEHVQSQREPDGREAFHR